MVRFLAVYESSTTQYVNINMEDVSFVDIISDNSGIQFQLSNGKIVKCALNFTDATGVKSVREYMQSRMMELLSSSPTTSVLTLPTKLPFTLSASEEESGQAEFTTVTFA
tara:strand:- start:1047 stop:1376 length:330 start_codon:yes stop_codon:yes gene_type:complete